MDTLKTLRASVSRKTIIAASVMAAPAIVHMSAYAYANTLTAVISDLYTGLDVASRELIGFIPAVGRAPGVERAAVGQSVVYPIVPEAVATDIVPAMAFPVESNQTIAGGVMTITKQRKASFSWNGEEQRNMNNSVGYQTLQARQFAEGIRTLANEMEADLAAEGMANASRAVGSAGVTPFATTLGDAAQVRKALDDNGAPGSGRSLIIDTTAGAAIRTLSQLTKVNEAGTQMALRDGQLLDLFGLSIHESAKVGSFVKGTNNGAAATTAAGFAVGSTTIALGSAGTGTIKVGDFVTFAGDTNKYQIVTGDADVSNGGTIVIADPGLRVAIPAAATVITTVASYTASVAFSQDALHLVTRLPALPTQGDMALDRLTITDPRSGISFEVSIYPGYRMIEAEVAAVWGVKAVKRRHIVILLG